MIASGFTAAPVSRILLFGLIASSVLVSVTDIKHFFPIRVDTHLWRYKQFWRLLLWQTCYTNSTSLLFAVMTCYHLRVIERLWGSRKFASFLLSILPATMLFPPILLALFLRPLSLNTMNVLPSGPTPIIFAILAQYHAAIPTVYQYRLATSPSPASRDDSSRQRASFLLLSDKSIHYLLAAQLALSSLPGSLLTAGVGWGLGVAWRNELGPAVWASWRVPEWLSGDKRREGEGFEDLRRRLEAEGRGSAVDEEGREGTRRRTFGRGILDQFRGAL